jgi:hypothetical protein
VEWGSQLVKQNITMRCGDLTRKDVGFKQQTTKQKCVLTKTMMAYDHVYGGLSKCLLLVWLINRNSLRAASCLVFETLTYLNSVKPCILSFMFEAVAKISSKC